MHYNKAVEQKDVGIFLLIWGHPSTGQTVTVTATLARWPATTLFCDDSVTRMFLITSILIPRLLVLTQEVVIKF